MSEQTPCRDGLAKPAPVSTPAGLVGCVTHTDLGDLINLADLRSAMAHLDADRKAMGLSLADMEEKSGVATNSFYAWRSGQRQPQLPLLVAIAQTLGWEVVMKPASPGSRLLPPRQNRHNARETARVNR